MPLPPITRNASTASIAAPVAALMAAPMAALVAAHIVALAAVPEFVAAAASSIEFFAVRAAPARRADEGLIVLDLEGLESHDAALALAAGWRQRHGDDTVHVTLAAEIGEQVALAENEILDVDAALAELARLEPRLARVVEMR